MKVGKCLKGQRFGRLVVVDDAITGRTKKRLACVCDCGELAMVAVLKLRSGRTQSCGCLRLELQRARRKHGHCSEGQISPEYRAHRGMLDRCYREDSANFHSYGGRGILVADRWRFGEGGKSGFECFVQDFGLRPSPDHSLDRKEVDGNYEPDNVRWATRLEQMRNQQKTIMVTVADCTMSLPDALEYFKAPKRATVLSRIGRRWSMDDAFLLPIGSKPQRPQPLPF